MTDQQLIHTIRRFIAADKPEDITPLDELQVIAMLIRHADEKDIYPSQDTLAQELCSSPDAIARSQRRLQVHGWLVVRKGGYRGRTNRYTIQMDKLPLGDLSRTLVSHDAKQLAMDYGNLVKVQTRKKFMRNWRQQWSFQAQKLINRTGDAQEVRKIINFELTQAAYRMKVLRGPSELRKCWGPLRAAYDHATRVAAQKAADMAQQASTPNAPSGVNTAAAGK